MRFLTNLKKSDKFSKKKKTGLSHIEVLKIFHTIMSHNQMSLIVLEFYKMTNF